MTQEYSIENGYYVVYSVDVKTKMTTAFLAIRVDARQLKKDGLLHSLRKKHNRQFTYALSPNGITLSMKRKLSENVIQEIIADITLQLQASGYQQSCMLSGSTDALSLYQLGKDKIITNDTALLNHVNNARQAAEQPINPFMGLIGGIIGILIGTIIWTIIAYLGWFVGWIGFLIVFLGIYGFKLLGKRITQGWAIVIMLLSLLSIVLSQFAYLGFAIYSTLKNDFGISLTFSEALSYIPTFLAEPDIRTPFITNTVLGLIIGIIGMFSAVKGIPTEKELFENLQYTRLCSKD